MPPPPATPTVTQTFLFFSSPNCLSCQCFRIGVSASSCDITKGCFFFRSACLWKAEVLPEGWTLTPEKELTEGVKSSFQTRGGGAGCGPGSPPVLWVPGVGPDNLLHPSGPLLGLLLLHPLPALTLKLSVCCCGLRSLRFSPPRAEKPISVPWLSPSEPPPNFPNLFFSPPQDGRTIWPVDPCWSGSGAAGRSGDSFVRQKSKSDCLCPSSPVSRSSAASR